MKKYLVLISCFFCRSLYAQDIAIQLQYRPGPDSFYVYLDPDYSANPYLVGPSSITLVFGNAFTIGSPATSSFEVTSFFGGTWNAQDMVVDPDPPNLKYVTFINGAGAPIPNGVTDGNRVLLFRFRLVAGGNCVSTLRNYANGVDEEDPSGTFSFSFLTYIFQGGVEHYSTNNSVTMQSCAMIVLPVKILSFNARREGNSGVANWTATGEDANSDYYLLERSLDGSNFQSIATIDARNLPGDQTYEYTDPNAGSLNARVVYYRLKQVDMDGRSTMSSIRQIRFDIGPGGVQMYPNPVVSGFYINVPFSNPDDSKVQLTIINSAGQPVATREITAKLATNYYFDMKGSLLAAGDYYLRILHQDRVVDIKKFVKAKE